MNYNVYCVKIALAYNIYGVKIGGRMDRIYLAGPYTHETQRFMDLRFELLTKIAATLSEIFDVFSPITHSHPMSKYMQTMDVEYWCKKNVPFLEWCDKMVVAELHGWDRSGGVYLEMLWCEQNNKPIDYWQV